MYWLRNIYTVSYCLLRCPLHYTYVHYGGCMCIHMYNYYTYHLPSSNRWNRNKQFTCSVCLWICLTLYVWYYSNLCMWCCMWLPTLLTTVTFLFLPFLGSMSTISNRHVYYFIILAILATFYFYILVICMHFWPTSWNFWPFVLWYLLSWIIYQLLNVISHP